MKKVPIIHFIWLCVPVLLLATSALADTAADLQQAQGCYKAGQYAQAEQAYRNILQGAANNPDAVYQVGKMLPQVYLATDRPTEVQAAVQQLLTNCAANEWLPHALHEIIEQAKALNRTSLAGQICRNILTAQPDHPQALWLKMGVVIANVYGGNSQAVDTGVQDIVANHSADRWAGEALAQIGWAYDKLGQYDKGRPLYEYVVDHWPDKPRVVFAHTALVRGCIRLNDKQAAQSRLQQLVSRYAEDAHLPNVLNEIARGYREARMYQEAKPVSQYVLDHYPDSDQRIWADRDILLCDVRLYNQDAAEAGFQKLVSRHAENGYLPYVLVEISGQYRQVRMHAQARSASQYVLDHYPDSDQCLWAERDVVLSDLLLRDPNAADVEAQKLVNRFASRADALWAVSEIAETNSRLGRHQQARDLYRFNVTNYPPSNDTIWSLRSFINESVALNDVASTDAGIKKLLSEYAASKNLPMAVLHAGRTLCNAGRPQQASDLFQYVIDKYPNHEQALMAKVCIGHVYLRQGQDSRAEALYQRILTDYANHPDLAEAVNLMGEGYFDQGVALEQADAKRLGAAEYAKLVRGQGRTDIVRNYYQRAIEKWQITAQKLSPSSDFAARAWYFIGVVYYQHLGDAEKARSCPACRGNSTCGRVTGDDSTPRPPACQGYGSEH